MRPAQAPRPPVPSHRRVRLVAEEVLSDSWYLLKKTTFDFLRRDGQWQRQVRETYDRGNGAALLLFNAQKDTVLLTRQFRYPAFVNGCSEGLMVEVCAGLLDGDDPEACIRREAEEETGYRVKRARKLFEAYMSPGSVTEKLHFFAAEVDDTDRVGPGGGERHEGEDIEVLEMPLAEALRQVASGGIQDGKTIMLLQHAALVGLAALRMP